MTTDSIGIPMHDARTTKRAFTITERRALKINGVVIRLVLSKRRKGRRVTVLIDGPPGTQVIRLDQSDSPVDT